MRSPEQLAMAEATSYLARREYTAAELTSKLATKHGDSSSQAVVNRLVEAGIVSDERAVEAMLYKLTDRKIVGDSEIRAKLEQLGIGRDEADQIIAIQVAPEIDRANQLVLKRFEKGATPPKIGRFLYSRGFDESTIESVLENLPRTESE